MVIERKATARDLDRNTHKYDPRSNSLTNNNYIDFDLVFGMKCGMHTITKTIHVAVVQNLFRMTKSKEERQKTRNNDSSKKSDNNNTRKRKTNKIKRIMCNSLLQ